VETIEATLRGLGYVVSRNKPYAGGFITEHYGNPAVGLHAIQLEINRALYMDERRYERSAAFAGVAQTWRRWRNGSPRSRSMSCGPIALRPNSRTQTQAAALRDRILKEIESLRDRIRAARYSQAARSLGRKRQEESSIVGRTLSDTAPQ